MMYKGSDPLKELNPRMRIFDPPSILPSLLMVSPDTRPCIWVTISPEGAFNDCSVFTTDTDPTKTSVSIAHRSLVPRYCCDCGRPTDRYVKIVRRVSRGADVADSPAGMLSVLGLLVSWWFLPFAVMCGLRDRTGDVVVVEIPQCGVCGDQGKPAPIRVNSEELRMTFVVHRDFRKQIADRSSSADDATRSAS